MVQREWLDTLRVWSAEGDTKLHFFAEKVLYNCRQEDAGAPADAPIFLLYDSGHDKEVPVGGDSEP